MKQIKLDAYEIEIESNLEKSTPVANVEVLMEKVKLAAKEHVKRKKSVTLRVPEMDLEAIRIKASKLGIPYQSYIGMLIHKDATGRAS
jgi:predicted DNA binding CopG/RHH family protein